MDPMQPVILTTTDSLNGRQVRSTLGLIEGSSAVSPGIGGGISASLAAWNPGRVEQLEELLRKARAMARREMVERARELEADAVLGVRYATSDIYQGVSEIMVYGTAVTLEPEPAGRPRLTAPPAGS